jgi:hypothetical protein
MYALCECDLLWSVQSLRLLSLTPSPPSPHFSTSFNTHPSILSTFTSCAMWYYWCSIILFSFPSFPEFHNCTIANMFYVWVYIWSCLFLCICLSLDLSCMIENMCFWSWLTSLNMMSSNCIHLPVNNIPRDFLLRYFSPWLLCPFQARNLVVVHV